MMREITKEQIVVDMMALKYDYHNLKVMIKARKLDKDLSYLYIPIGTVDFAKLESSFLADDLRDFGAEFKEAIDAVLSDYESTIDPQRIDLILDKYYFSHLYKLAKKTGIQFFIEYVEDMIDFTNVKTLIRLKRQGKDMKFLEDVLLANGKIEIGRAHV